MTAKPALATRDDTAAPAFAIFRALIGRELLIELAFAEIGRNPIAAAAILAALCRGRTALRRRLAASAAFDPGSLPYDPASLELVRDARARGQAIGIAGDADDPFLKEIARHVGGTISPDGGTGTALLAPAARAASRSGWRVWARQLRLPQYAKNALVFVPLLAAHRFALGDIVTELLAALAFCLCASSVYVLNDLVDLRADRAHPRKRDRPLASGRISLAHALVAAPLLLVLALALAAGISRPFVAVVLAYFTLTTAYSFSLKRKMMIDAVVLAMLYTARIIGGAIAIDVVVSEWLLAASMFIFTSLALIKRYVELAARLDAGLDNPSNRDYRIADLDIVGMLAAASGFNTVTVLALWISSDTARHLYRHPQLLWLMCPVMIYWFGRLLMLAHRRGIEDDPVAFALRDRVSIMTGILVVAILLAAI